LEFEKYFSIYDVPFLVPHSKVHKRKRDHHLYLLYIENKHNGNIHIGATSLEPLTSSGIIHQSGISGCRKLSEFLHFINLQTNFGIATSTMFAGRTKILYRGAIVSGTVELSAKLDQSSIFQFPRNHPSYPWY
jgi:hypothetical protein